MHHFRLEREESYISARDLLTQAISHDPAFALAHVTLASTHSVMAIDGYEAPKIAWPESTASITRALAIDPDLPDAHAEASAAAFYYRWDWQAADRDVANRLEVAPRRSPARAADLTGASDVGARAPRRRLAVCARSTDWPIPSAPHASCAKPICWRMLASSMRRPPCIARSLATHPMIPARITAWPRCVASRIDSTRPSPRGKVAARPQAIKLRGTAICAGRPATHAIEQDEAGQQLDGLRARAVSGAYMSRHSSYTRACTRGSEIRRARSSTWPLVSRITPRAWSSCESTRRGDASGMIRDFATPVRQVGLPETA